MSKHRRKQIKIIIQRKDKTNKSKCKENTSATPTKCPQGEEKFKELEKTILYRSPRQGGILSPKRLRYLCGFSISHLSTHFLHVTMTYGFYFVGGRPGGGEVLLGISGWGCAARTLGPSTYTRASSAEFCSPILE